MAENRAVYTADSFYYKPAEKEAIITEAQARLTAENDTALEILAQNVDARRVELGYTKEMLATIAGVGVNSLLRIRKKENSSVLTLMAVADALQCTLADLFIDGFF